MQNACTTHHLAGALLLQEVRAVAAGGHALALGQTIDCVRRHPGRTHRTHSDIALH